MQHIHPRTWCNIKSVRPWPSEMTGKIHIRSLFYCRHIYTLVWFTGYFSTCVHTHWMFHRKGITWMESAKWRGSRWESRDGEKKSVHEDKRSYGKEIEEVSVRMRIILKVEWLGISNCKNSMSFRKAGREMRKEWPEWELRGEELQLWNEE